MNVIHCISSTNRWIDGANQPRDWHIPETLYQLPTRQLDRMASNSRVLI